MMHPFPIASTESAMPDPTEVAHSHPDEMSLSQGDEGPEGAPEEISGTLTTSVEDSMHGFPGRDDEHSHDEDDITIVTLDQDIEYGARNGHMASTWLDGHSFDQRRRAVLMRELQRVQRASFIHFLLLCLIPTILLVVVVVTVMREGDDCSSQVTNCYAEGRTFSNAFTSQCICEAIDVTNGIN
jgi:hypothetical protein